MYRKEIKVYKDNKLIYENDMFGEARAFDSIEIPKLFTEVIEPELSTLEMKHLYDEGTIKVYEGWFGVYRVRLSIGKENEV